MSARIGVTLRTTSTAGGRKVGIPLETFAVNKSMGRVLFRRSGETIGTFPLTPFDRPADGNGGLLAAGIVLEVTP